jgi:Ribonuclease toxin, BrnT, of type II toxin-antitoxin system
MAKDRRMVEVGSLDESELRVGPEEGRGEPSEARRFVRRGVAGFRRSIGPHLLARIFDDPDHSETEPRELIVGHCTRQRLLVVSFLQRGDRIRILSARKATRQERKDYEEGTAS